MRIDKLAMTSREALQAAIGIAGDAEAGAVEPIHLLSALLTSGERNISVIIERIGADPAQLSRATQEAIDRAPKVTGDGAQVGLSRDLVRVLERAEKHAGKMGDSFVVTEHLLMALAEDKGDAGRVLNDAGVTRERIEEVYQELRGDDRVTSAEDKAQFEALEQYGRNVCDLARAGKLDPVIGRSEEIRRTIQVLSRRTKNNPVLIGEPGVGKTAIAEGKYIKAEEATRDLADFMAMFKKFAMNIPPRAVKSIAGYADPQTARAMERAMRKELEDMLAVFVDAAEIGPEEAEP